MVIDPDWSGDVLIADPTHVAFEGVNGFEGLDGIEGVNGIERLDGIGRLDTGAPDAEPTEHWHWDDPMDPATDNGHWTGAIRVEGEPDPSGSAGGSGSASGSDTASSDDAAPRPPEHP